MKKTCIFTTYNFQIDEKLIQAHHAVINKIIAGTGVVFMPLRYNLPRKFIQHYQALDYGLIRLVNEYDNILTLDVDCIPLSTDALMYTVEKIEQNTLIGCAQRSMHIENDRHIYVGSPCFGLNKNLYQMFNSSTVPTIRGDTAEEFTYLAEQQGVTVEMFTPSKYETDPLGGPAWELADSTQRYGIGTTFNNHLNSEMFYHLFESRTGAFNQLFINKCKELL